METKKYILDFSTSYCTTQSELLSSEKFERLLSSYLTRKIKEEHPDVLALQSLSLSKHDFTSDFLKVIKKLHIFTIEELFKMSADTVTLRYLEPYYKERLLRVLNMFYDHWRSLERYATISNPSKDREMSPHVFISQNDMFRQLVLSTYRTIEEKIAGRKSKAYRQLSAGSMIGLILNHYYDHPLPEPYMNILHNVPIVEHVLIQPPVNVSSSRNTRDGIFEELHNDPLKNIEPLSGSDWFGFPVLVGKLVALVYVHKNYLMHGVALANLFEFADLSDVEKPDMIYIFGGEDKTPYIGYYKDKLHNIYLGYGSYSTEYDYFGYMKKMLLTLHNVTMIDRGMLPIHGAMIRLTLEHNEKRNIVIIGDSGAGKSETIEALRLVADTKIKHMNVIYDDMGVFHYDKDGAIRSHGTEIGAFVRVDDLDKGYAFKQMDRGIFMNIDKTNARVIIPIEAYKTIARSYPIDAVLYANNYTAHDGIRSLETLDEVLDVFEKGRRFAKGTTTETGLVETYFANPFGPVQQQNETQLLLKKYMDDLMQSGVFIGELNTQLACENMQAKGPERAAEALLEYLI